MATDDSPKAFDDTEYRERSAKRYKWGRRVSVGGIVFGVLIAVFADKPIWYLSLNEIGDFLAGIFAPLAFLWLVIGYFQQGDELRLTRNEIKRQADELAGSVKHQGTLADLAEKTHDADMKDRRRRNTIETKRAQPRFTHEKKAVDNRADEIYINPQTSTLLLSIRNDGETCWSFYVESLVIEDGFEVRSPSIHEVVSIFSMHERKQITFHIPARFVTEKCVIKYKLHYVDKLLENSWQEFEICYKGSKLINVELLATSHMEDSG